MEKKTFWKRSEDYAKKVSGEIIEQIKAGVAPWQKPWKPGEAISAENFSTGQKYTGGNSLYLMSRAIRDGRGDNRWGTYNQIQSGGGTGSQRRERDEGLVFQGPDGARVEGRAGQGAQGQGRQDDLRRRAAGPIRCANSTRCSMSSRPTGWS